MCICISFFKKKNKNKKPKTVDIFSCKQGANGRRYQATQTHIELM